MRFLGLELGRRPINGGLNSAERIHLESAEVHVRRGEEAIERSDLETAVLEFKYAVIAEGKNATALRHLRGSVLGPLNAKRTTRAQSLFERAHKAQSRGNHRHAVSLLTEAIDLCPIAAVPSFAFRGKSNLALGRYEEAAADFSIAISYAPNVAEAYAERAEAYEALGSGQAARQDREKARALMRAQE